MNSLKGWGLLLFRLFMGGRILYSVLDLILNSDKMALLVGFLENNGVPMAGLAAPITVYAQLVCALLIIIGFETRYAAAIMLVNFLVALFSFDIQNPIEVMTPTLAMIFGSLLLLFEGPGRFSIDEGRKKS